MSLQPLSRQERRRQRTRQRLQQATVELLLEKGYQSLMIQDITDRADLGRGTFYIYFRDKEDIVWSIIQDGIDATTSKAHERFSHTVPPQLEYYGYVILFKHADQHRDLYRAVLGRQGSATITGRVQDYIIAHFLSEVGIVPSFTDFNVPEEVLAQIVIGAVIRLMLWWLETPNEYTPERMGAMVYEALHHRPAPKPPTG